MPASKIGKFQEQAHSENPNLIRSFRGHKNSVTSVTFGKDL